LKGVEAAICPYNKSQVGDGGQPLWLGVMHMAAVIERNYVYLALVEGTKFEEAKYG